MLVVQLKVEVGTLPYELYSVSSSLNVFFPAIQSSTFPFSYYQYVYNFKSLPRLMRLVMNNVLVLVVGYNQMNKPAGQPV